MSGQGWQPAQYDPYAQQQYQPLQAAPRSGLTAAGRFWYILMCIPLGAGYLAKVPAKKALADAGLATLTGAESFWYIAMCILPPFGGYFAKIPTAKAVSELAQFRR
jgi:hypothetical protein